MKKGIMTGISLLAGFAGGAATVGTVMKRTGSLTNKQSDLYQSCYNIVSQWLTCKQRGISLDKYFKKKRYYSIAIYGMGRLGSMLYDELKDTDIEIRYAIDQDAYCTCLGLKIVEPDDKLDKVDAIIVTPVLVYDEIQKKLSDKTDIPVISIEDVVYGL